MFSKMKLLTVLGGSYRRRYGRDDPLVEIGEIIISVECFEKIRF